VSVADWACLDLANDEAALRERLISVEEDCAVYRELVLVAFDAVRELTVRNQQLHDDNLRLRDELRTLHETYLIAAGAADIEAAS
jgi:hypothetical protein